LIIARAEAPLAFFCADTLGAPIDVAASFRDVGFDFIFNSFAWWDWQSPWFLEQHDLLRGIAPTIGFPLPSVHELQTARPDGGNGADPVFIEARYRHRYALAAGCSSGLMMPTGYEFGGLAGVAAQSALRSSNEPLLDLSDFITEFNGA